MLTKRANILFTYEASKSPLGTQFRANSSSKQTRATLQQVLIWLRNRPTEPIGWRARIFILSALRAARPGLRNAFGVHTQTETRTETRTETKLLGGVINGFVSASTQPSAQFALATV